MTHYLKPLFQPSSIVVIGASDRSNSVGKKVFRNLLQEKFVGRLYAVNPKHKEVQGEPCFASVKEITPAIDLAVITTPAHTVPTILRECGEKGIRAAIVISSGFSEIGEAGKTLEQTMLAIARDYHIRLIGPNCLGVMRPHLKMNATFDNNFALPDGLALVSQSGAISAAILDWAMNKQIGFSTIVSMGNSADVDFGDVLDYLAVDPETKSILLYIEGIHHSRRFMSGLRAAARTKPVIAIKSGRNQQGSRAALSHTGALIGNDDVFDIALRRADAVRVMTIEELFSAAEILSSKHARVKGNHLVVITNGGGAGVMAADFAAESRITLPALNEDTIAALNKVLPTQWSHQNPVDIIGDAPPKRYHAALEICQKIEEIQGILAILVPVAMSRSLKVAKQIIEDAKHSDKLILTCWMGEKQVSSSWKLFEKHKIPYFDTPEKAIAAFSYLADYHHSQQLLLQIPEPLSPQPAPDIAYARSMIESILQTERRVLTASESKAILKAFFIPVSEPIAVNNKAESLVIAKSLGFPVVMKINSPDISHKQDVGGVALNITEDKVEATFDAILHNAKKANPNATILGVTIERMYHHANDRELMIGVISDKVFGPVISFGMGGSLVEIIQDRALALPPLNKFIAENLIARTRAAKLLGNFRNMPAVDMKQLINILLRVSEMVCALPFIQEMDINPLIANDKEMIAVDARIVIAPVASHSPYDHMAIHPYPDYLISTWQAHNGQTITIRPIRPEDADIEQTFIKQLSAQTKYFRFMENFTELSPAMLARLTQIDYDKEMAFVAIDDSEGKEKSIGIARYAINADQVTCEFALVVADAWQQKGLGFQLLTSLIEAAKIKGLKAMEGWVLTNNRAMLELTKYLGFEIIDTNELNIKKVIKTLF